MTECHVETVWTEVANNSPQAVDVTVNDNLGKKILVWKIKIRSSYADTSLKTVEKAETEDATPSRS